MTYLIMFAVYSLGIVTGALIIRFLRPDPIHIVAGEKPEVHLSTKERKKIDEVETGVTFLDEDHENRIAGELAGIDYVAEK